MSEVTRSGNNDIYIHRKWIYKNAHKNFIFNTYNNNICWKYNMHYSTDTKIQQGHFFLVGKPIILLDPASIIPSRL